MTEALFTLLKGEAAIDTLPTALAERVRKSNAHSTPEKALLEREIAFCQGHNIRIICYGDPDYPQRLTVCPDAPLMLFYLGNANLNARHIISIVGTRRITPYGKDLCQCITEDIARLLPDTLVVSGLAYGTDIHAHRGALNTGLSTVGVLAHGLDRIYPYSHKDTATHMTRQGGLLTEYLTGTEPERYNFVHRNRIVAAMADCTIVVESARQGGSMITLQRANDFNRPVFACPGRLTDLASEGCNRAIAEGRAKAFTGVEDLVDALGWQPTTATDARQQSLFPSITDIDDEARKILTVLAPTEGMTADQLAAATGLPVFQINAAMTDLEMQGLVSILPGGVCRAQMRR